MKPPKYDEQGLTATGRFLVRLLGGERFDRISAKLDAWEAKSKERCPWTNVWGERCIWYPGHGGSCQTRDVHGLPQYWCGINCRHDEHGYTREVP